jgi:protocatechuate 3,4-dioxygenase alpha subunit
LRNLLLTSSATVGPFFAPCLLREDAVRNNLILPETAGEHIRIEGRVIDGEGAPVMDALVEIWQANPDGIYNHPADPAFSGVDTAFSGFGRSGIGNDGKYRFNTLKPGPVPFNNARMQAPHICVTIFSRGLLNHLMTRLYFEDEPSNADDPILQSVPANRRATLVARRQASEDSKVYHFDIILQGQGETAFFNL